MRSFHTDVSRQDWMDNLSHLRIESYEIEISTGHRADKGVRDQAPSGAYVTLTEFWTLLSPGGRRIEKRVESVDLWVRQQSVWKQVSRLSRSDQSPELLPENWLPCPISVL